MKIVKPNPFEPQSLVLPTFFDHKSPHFYINNVCIYNDARKQ